MDMDEKGQGRTRECGQMKRIENWFMLFLTWSIQEITRLTMISSQAFLGCLKECCMRSCRGVELRLSHTESRVKTLKRDTGTVFDMVNGVGCSGFGWDFNTNMVVAEKQVWDGYVQSHKRAAPWKNRSFPHCDMLCIIFERDRAMGKHAVTADDVLEEVSRNESIDTKFEC
ncbi:hypothetical protein CsSME_00050667 [Camellia sinensis var. sinensis]|nr:uncharacterized protein LOC114261208 isoform X2 [Camellia sinensis]XP_028057238.1 uncharacterized protein LOC114261208 isoform X2 [Camellia sinensis]XP_028057239.1 uncharacterized protein LOC114261208 isoform X2 [Camellia sinensis]XP_028057240.1 uncharacterized protein LOC114261208 isoform X2 [Camellia sinensis]